MRAMVLVSLLAWANVAQASDFWNSLWQTADQRGEQLMRQGKPAEAARVFSDPRRKAYAELQAGDFQQAAKDFAAFDDSNGHYNRGNALARAGQLQEALKAYDAALARAPKDSDARYNRDLVASALQNQPPQPDSGKNSGKDARNDSNSGEKKDQGNKDAGKQGADRKTTPQSSDNGQQNQARQDKQADQNKGAEQQASQGQQPPASPGQQQKPGDEAAQAKLDAAAALDKSPPGAKSARIDAPASEKQLAQEQWLRGIPDDPGGLLRRKFMIEHMIRQQGAKP